MNPRCELPGCGREKERFADIGGWHLECPRNADAHALCAKLAESEAKVKELEAKLAEADLCEENILAVLPEDFGAVEYIKYLEGEQNRIPDLVHENESLASTNTALEAKLAECCYVIRSMTSRAVLDGFESPDELEAWMKEIFKTGYKWLQDNRDLVKKDDEARKKGAEHGE